LLKVCIPKLELGNETKPISNSYDIYSGQNFDTIPTSKWGWLGYGNNKLMENEKNNEK
jgi:hypothetical protein